MAKSRKRQPACRYRVVVGRVKDTRVGNVKYTVHCASSKRLALARGARLSRGRKRVQVGHGATLIAQCSYGVCEVLKTTQYKLFLGAKKKR